MFLKCFLHSLLVNLLFLVNLEERTTHRELYCFLGVEDDSLEGGDLVNKATGEVFALFWKTMILLAEEVLPCFQE